MRSALAVVLLLLGSRSVPGAILVVDDDLRDCPGAAYRRIPDAVAAAQSGDQIQICAGAYPEQVVITKPLRLIGQGAVIQTTDLPDTRPSLLGGRLVTGAIVVDGTSAVISGLTIDLGSATFAQCSPLLAGIYVRGARTVVTGVRVAGVRIAGQPACDSGIGVYAESGPDPASARTMLTVRDSNFSGCQKAGVVANGAGTVLRMRGGEVAGDGPSAAAVQEGVQLGLGARGKVGQVHVTGHASSVPGRTAAGIVLYRAGKAIVRGTTVGDGQTGIFVVGHAQLRGNTLTNLGADGIVLFGDNSSVVSNTVDGAGISGIFLNGNMNTIRFGSIANAPVGLWFYGGAANGFSGVTFAPSVPLHGQGVYGGTRDLTATSAAPVVPACQSDADCDDGTSCTTDSCDPATGTCTNVFLCDDGNPCTDDGCSAAGCEWAPNTAACSDGNACTVNDFCQGGTCHAGLPIACDDGNPCTLDSCSPALGCVHPAAPAGTPCPTGTCSGGVCL